MRHATFDLATTLPNANRPLMEWSAIGFRAGLGVLLWIGACAASLALPGRIVPGRSIGHIRLGEAAGRATDPLGTAQKSDGAMGRFWGVWTSRSPSKATRYELDVLTIRGESGLHEYVEQVRVTSPWFTTDNGIRVGSRLSDVIKVFPRARPIHDARFPAKRQTIALYDDVRQGITFEFARTARRAFVSPRCRAIVVHPRRKSVLGEYYPWYGPDDRGMLHYAL